MRDVMIRPYHPSDLEPCRALWAELTLHHRKIYNDSTIGGDAPGFFFDRHLARVGPGRIWVAEQEGKVIGLVGLIVNDQEAEVEPIVVASTHRHQGIGRALLGRMIEEAGKLGVRYLGVRPVARNVDAIAFFHDAGFRTLGHIELFIELTPSAPGEWKSGLELFGHAFGY